jgi:GTP-binding protein Era
VGPGDRFIVERLARLRRTPIIALITKTDKVHPARVGEHLLAVEELGRELLGPDGFAQLVPVSALKGDQVAVVDDVIAERLPLSAPLYPDGDLTDEPEAVLVAELIREAALEGVRDELPHSLAVVVEEMEAREDRPEDNPLTDIHATVYVERSSQKAIVIGKGGKHLRDVGARARTGIEKLLGTKVFLDLHVKVAKEWQRDPKQLGRLGF